MSSEACRKGSEKAVIVLSWSWDSPCHLFCLIAFRPDLSGLLFQPNVLGLLVFQPDLFGLLTFQPDLAMKRALVKVREREWKGVWRTDIDVDDLLQDTCYQAPAVRCSCGTAPRRWDVMKARQGLLYLARKTGN